MEGKDICTSLRLNYTLSTSTIKGIFIINIHFMGEEEPANFYNYYHEIESHGKRMEFIERELRTTGY
jgi:hypothetical protein